MRYDIEIYEIFKGKKKLAYTAFKLPDNSNESIYYELCFCYNRGCEFTEKPIFKRKIKNTLFVNVGAKQFFIKSFKSKK